MVTWCLGGALDWRLDKEVEFNVLGFYIVFNLNLPLVFPGSAARPPPFPGRQCFVITPQSHAVRTVALSWKQLFFSFFFSNWWVATLKWVTGLWTVSLFLKMKNAGKMWMIVFCFVFFHMNDRHENQKDNSCEYLDSYFVEHISILSIINSQDVMERSLMKLSAVE